jgi:GDPmannose 4,6-dehydratase
MSQKTALITGITGQDGSYLAEFLLHKGYKIHGIVRRSSSFNRGRIEHLFDDLRIRAKDIVLHYGDLGDTNSLFRIVKESKPDEVYNLAAQSHVDISFTIPEYTGDITALGVTRLLEVLRTSGLPVKFYQASSSELFGKVSESPQTEKTPFHARSPYACAKEYAFALTRNYREAYDMFAVNGILFNHESPRRGKNFVTRKITSSLANIYAGKQDCLYLGNLDAKRDWGYAKEFVEGMWLMLQQEKPDDYILATGKTHSVREFLELCLHYAGIDYEKTGEGTGEHYIDTKTGKTIVAVDREYYRPSEVDVLQGDASKAERELGWKPKTTLSDLAKLMVEEDFCSVGLSI